MTDQSTTDVLDMREWTPAKTFDDVALVCCGKRHLNLLSDPDAFSLTQRVRRIGPVTLSGLISGADMSMDRGELCNNCWVVVLQSGTAAVYAPADLGAARWAGAAKMICFKIDRCAVDDALSDALGRQMTSLPFVDSLVRGFMLAAEHSDRDALMGDDQPGAPRAIRTAVDIIEAEAHSPLTLSSIAASCHVSVRSLQQGFRRHLGTSPMAYLREVRLRRAHQTLLESDPSMVTVASVACRWGFTNLGRFAAAHTARYGELPAQTLRRRASHRCEQRTPDRVLTRACCGTGIEETGLLGDTG